MSEVELNKIDFLSLDSLIYAVGEKSFFVAPYQRGYRWDDSVIEYLLKDIWSAPKDKKISLQPVTILNNTFNNKEVWELVDGQQRLTTIYLILSLFKNKFELDQKPYNIIYKTRDSTREFLEEINKGGLDLYLSMVLSDDFKEEKVWKEFLSNDKTEGQKDNIDNYYLFCAYLFIYKWISNHLKKSEIGVFYNKLLNDVFLIWYPISLKSQSIEDRFININDGKIKLTDAELIKALFILEVQNSNEKWDIKQTKIRQFAEEWDTLEKRMHSDDFWYFINGSSKNTYQTRIDLLFELISNKNKKQTVYDWFAEDKTRLSWEKVLNAYNRLNEWYNDIEIYHKVGFLIQANIKSLKYILTNTTNLNKSKVKSELDEWIKLKFNSTKTRDKKQLKRFFLDNLNYEDDNEGCQILLLFYNIKLLEKTYPGQRFPFDLYQKESWSLEHIHPQNPKSIKDKNHALSWLNDYKSRENELNDNQKESFRDEVKNLKTSINSLKSDKSLNQDLQEQLANFIEKYKSDFDLHGIANLALLDKNINSSLSNLPFKDKRQKAIKHSENKYIPLGTLDCFMKKQSDTDSLQMKYWSEKDMLDYQEVIESILVDYIPTENGKL